MFDKEDLNYAFNHLKHRIAVAFKLLTNRDGDITVVISAPSYELAARNGLDAWIDAHKNVTIRSIEIVGIAYHCENN